MRYLLLAAIVGAGFGLCCGLLIWGVKSDEPYEELNNTERSSPSKLKSEEPPSKEDRESTTPDSASSAQPSTKEPITLFSEALMDYFSTNFTGAWIEHRSIRPTLNDIEAGENRFKETVLALPAMLGKGNADKRNQEDALRIAIEQGNGADLIMLAKEGMYTPDPDDSEWEIIDIAVTRRKSEQNIDETSFADDQELKLAEGITLTFKPGIHRFDERHLRGPDGQTLPSDITIQGSSMNNTMLKLGNISIAGNVERLHIKDITLDSENDGLFDLRSGSLVLNLERVRIVRFDAGHGGCDIFGTRGTLIRAQHSEFIGGYGKAPGKGDLFSGKPVLARFDMCRFELLDLSLELVQTNGQIVFNNCAFALLKKDPRSGKPNNVVFTNPVVESLINPQTPPGDLQKDIDDLFW